MKKISILVVVLFSVLQTFAQADSSKYTRYKNQYGQRLPRFWADSAMVLPSDTTSNKFGVAVKATTIYIGDGTKWSAVVGGSGGSITGGASGLATVGPNIILGSNPLNQDTRIKALTNYFEAISGDSSLAAQYVRLKVSLTNGLMEQRDNTANLRNYVNVNSGGVAIYSFNGTTSKTSTITNNAGTISLSATDSIMLVGLARMSPTGKVMLIYDSATHKVAYATVPSDHFTIRVNPTYFAVLGVNSDSLDYIGPTGIDLDSAVTFDPSNVVYKDTTQTLNNKTLTATTISGHLIPSAGYTYNFGSAANPFNKGYINDFYFDNLRPICGGCDFTFRFNDGGPGGAQVLKGQYSDKSIIIDKTGTFTSDGSDFQVKGVASITGKLKVAGTDSVGGTPPNMISIDPVTKELKRYAVSSGGGSQSINSVLSVDSATKRSMFARSVSNDHNLSISSSKIPDSTIFWGTSITYGTGPTVDSLKYSTRTCQLLGTNQVNKGISGTTMQGTGNAMVQRAINGEIPAYGPIYRAMFFEYSTNDANGDTTVLTVSSFTTAYNRVIDSCISKGWPYNKIVLLAPTYGIMTNQYRLLQYVNAVKSIGASRGILVIDQDSAMLASGNAVQYLYDNLHPNDLGSDFLARNIAANLPPTLVQGIDNVRGYTQLGKVSYHNGLIDNSTIYPIGNVARSAYFKPRLIAQHTNDVLSAMDIAPIFNDNGQTGVTHYGLRTGGGSTLLGNSNLGPHSTEGDVAVPLGNSLVSYQPGYNETSFKLFNSANGNTELRNYYGGDVQFYHGSSQVLTFQFTGDGSFKPRKNIFMYGSASTTGTADGDIQLAYSGAIRGGGGTAEGAIIPLTATYGNTELRNYYSAGGIGAYVSGGTTGSQLQAMYIKPTGQVGINTGSPDSTLTVNGSLNTSGGVKFSGIPSAKKSKVLYYDPTTKSVSYGDSTIGGGGGGGSGITSFGTPSGSNANGATVSGTTGTLTFADNTNPGIVSNTTQSFSGIKTLTDGLSSGVIYINSTNNSYSAYTISRYANKITMNTGTAGFHINNDANSANLYDLDNTGVATMYAYGAGSNTGTLSYLAGFNSSGKLIEVNPSSVGGSGSGGGTPTLNFTGATGAGTSPSSAISGKDEWFKLQITTGTSPAGSGALLCTINLGSNSYGTQATAVFSPGNGNAASVVSSSGMYVSGGTNYIAFYINGTALSASTSYIWFVKVNGY